jgi:hypothetical protein
LFVEEIQSDWGQEGKKKGFGTTVGVPDGWSVSQRGGAWILSDLDGEVSRGPTKEAAIQAAVEAGELPAAETVIGIPSAPFVTKTEGWLNLALKRVMTMAVEGGYDRVAFVTGEQSAERYDLSKQVDRIHITKLKKGGFEFTAYKDGRDVIQRQQVAPHQTDHAMQRGQLAQPLPVDGLGQQAGDVSLGLRAWIAIAQGQQQGGG